MENTIQLHDKKFRIMIPAEQIDKAVDAVAQRINADYAGKETAQHRRTADFFRKAGEGGPLPGGFSVFFVIFAFR